MAKQKMMIIGFGRIGSRFTKIFSDGFHVEVYSSRDVSAEVLDIGATCVTDFSKAVSSSDYSVQRES